MSFATTRLTTFAVLLGLPVLHAVGCTVPARHFETDDETGGKSGAQGGSSTANGGTGMTTGAGGRMSGTGSSTGTAGAGDAGAAGDTGNGGSSNGGTSAGGKSGKGAGGGIVGPGGSEGTGGDIGTSGAGGEAGSGGEGGGNTSGGLPGLGGAPGTGGILNGGSGGTLSGGTGSGGAAKGGTSSGGSSKGGATSGGTTSGGSTGKGGSGGTGTCTAKAEICNNGLDDDCDGHIDDCVVVTSTFPDLNGAAAGKDVQINANALSGTGWRFQCRSARGTSVGSGVAWADCPTGANTRIVPRTTVESSSAANNGLWSTQVRGIFSDNATTDPVTLTYYMHSSLHSATRCTSPGTDQALFTAGRNFLADTGVFGTATQLRSPFIQLGFTPPVSSYFTVTTGQGTVKLMSLRRRFVRSADDKFVLITRNYASGRSGTCQALGFDTHETDGNPPTVPADRGRHWIDRCAAVVFNHNGAAACLIPSGSTFVQTSTHVSAYVRGAGYSPAADNFAWRKLLNRQASSGGLIHFSRKCTVANCTDGIYLPDIGLFPYF